MKGITQDDMKADAKKYPLVMKIRKTNLMELTLEQLQAIARVIDGETQAIKLVTTKAKFTDEQLEQVKEELSRHKDTIIVAPANPEPLYLAPVSEDLEEVESFIEPSVPGENPWPLKDDTSNLNLLNEQDKVAQSVTIECPVVEAVATTPKRKRAIAPAKATKASKATKKAEKPKAKEPSKGRTKQ